MATKEEIEQKEKQCKSVDDYINLAKEALQEEGNLDIVQRLLKSAENICSLPIEYIRIAEVYALGLNDTDYASDLFDEAEDNCFEPIEYAELGHSIAICLKDIDRAKENLLSAAKDAKKPNEILTIAKYVKSGINDDALAKELINKVASQCKTVSDFTKISQDIIKETGDKETAKIVYKQGENKIDGVEEVYNYCLGIFELFEDIKWIEQLLEDIETEAQFTKDFILLATSYKNFCKDDEKAYELLQSAKDYAMTGQENIELAMSYWNLFKDKDSAQKGFEKGLKDITDKQQLLDLAKRIAVEIGDFDLAKKFYSQAEIKMTSAKDYNLLAQEIINNLNDKDYAEQIYLRTVEKLNDPKDLMNLATEVVKNLNNKELVKSIYSKALDTIDKFSSIVELVQEIKNNQIDDEFVLKVLDKGKTLASGTNDNIKLSIKYIELLNDYETAEVILLEAEEIVTNLDEMKDVNSVVKQYFTNNQEWVKRVDDKLKKRQDNQNTYDAFQKRENSATTLKDLLVVVDEMMNQLDDKYYAKKLLSKAEGMLEKEFLNLDKYANLLSAILKHTQDEDWCIKIVERIAKERIYFVYELDKLFSIIKKVLKDETKANNLIERILKFKLINSVNENFNFYVKLSELILVHLYNKDWAKDIIKIAEKKAETHLDWCNLAFLAKKLDDISTSNKFLQNAINLCKDYKTGFELIEKMKVLGFSDDIIKSTYNSLKDQLRNKQDKIEWVDGIINLWSDKIWAEKEYKALKAEFTSKNDYELIKDRIAKRVEGKYY